MAGQFRAKRPSRAGPALLLLGLLGLAVVFGAPALEAADEATLGLQRWAALGDSSGAGVPRGGPGAMGRAYVSPELAAFFAAFDANGDARLQRGEAFQFFAWVEDHVAYRYDDEGQPSPVPGVPVGDGRPGREYEQRPRETFAERFGDCEDFAALEVAFLRHWGAAAYLAEVNQRNPFEADHGVAVVRWGAAEQDAQGPTGALAHYTLRAGNPFGVPPGVYVVLDHAGSDHFGRVSGAIPGGFHLFDVRDPR